jgi:hypothetical protein
MSAMFRHFQIDIRGPIFKYSVQTLVLLLVGFPCMHATLGALMESGCFKKVLSNFSI